MSFVQIEMRYDWAEVIAKKGREHYASMRELFPDIKFPDWKPDKEKPEYMYEREVLVDFETEGRALIDAGIEFTIKRFRGNKFLDEAFNKYRKSPAHIDQSSSATHVHIPNLGLLAIDQVDWMEDACTQELQQRLDEGWRILAVCPPANQRRPDYILGRTRK